MRCFVSYKGYQLKNTLYDDMMTFSENHVALFATKLRQKCVCSVWRDCCVLYDPISHEMHVVQQFNMVLPLNWLKTYPKKTLLYHFHAEKALRSKICNINFWIGNGPPPPFGSFPKIHQFWRCHPSLTLVSNLVNCMWFYLH